MPSNGELISHVPDACIHDAGADAANGNGDAERLLSESPLTQEEFPNDDVRSQASDMIRSDGSVEESGSDQEDDRG